MPAASVEQALATCRPDRATLIFDVDDVICPTSEQFRQQLSQMGVSYRAESPYFEQWQIFDAQGQPQAREVTTPLIGKWLMQFLPTQPPYAQAKSSIQSLGQYANIVILTNLWPEFAAARDANFARLAMDYPIIYWQNNKQPAVAALAEASLATAFIDDRAEHIESVRELNPEVYCDHFLADAEVRALAPATAAQSRSENWPQLTATLSQWLEQTRPS